MVCKAPGKICNAQTIVPCELRLRIAAVIRAAGQPRAAVPTCFCACTITTMAADSSPQRVVCLQPSATVILAAIGRLDRIVACTRYCADVCPEVRSNGRAIIADSWTAQSQQIIAAQPDLVIAAVPYQEKAVVEILKAGIRFLGLAPRTLADIYTDIATIAGVMGASESGRAVIAQMQREIDAVRTQVREHQTRGKTRPRVFCEEWDKPLIASQRWVAELVEAAGGEFLGDPGLQRSPESVLADDPDIVIASWCAAGDRVPLEKIVRDRGWEQMRAVKAGGVYCVRDELLNTPAPTLLLGLRALAAAIHPDSFPQPDGLRCIANVHDQIHSSQPG
jgi:iron complex transport system substrate-binding protein